MTIKIEIVAFNAEEARQEMRSLLFPFDSEGDCDLGPFAAVKNRIDFAAAAKAQVQTYEPDASDEAEVNEDIVQNVDTGATDGLDSAGEAWDEAIHSPNRTTTKDGRWRLKKGAVRPEPTEAASEPAATDEEDEFAAFANAMKTEEPVAEAEPVEVPARTWTDADLSKLCNMAAQKLGGGDPVKKIIATYTPEGEVPHSRNVPLESREDFAQAIEATAGIEYAG